MDSNETSQKKISTQDLFGDILGEVESAWEKRQQSRSKVQSDAGTGVGGDVQGQAAANDSSADSTPAQTASVETAKDSGAGEDSRTEQSVSAKPASANPGISPFAPQPVAGRSQNGHHEADGDRVSPAEREGTPARPLQETSSDVSAELTDQAPTAELPQPPEAAPGPQPQDEKPVGARAESMQPSLPSAGEPSPFSPLTSPAAEQPASLQASPPDSTALLPLQAQEQKATPGMDLPSSEVEVGTPYMPWMDEGSSTDWKRLAWMAAVVAGVGVGVWWFGLRPADTPESEPVQVVTEPSESFIAGLEGETTAGVSGEPTDSIAVEDQVTAVVEPPDQPPRDTQTAPVAQTVDANAAPSRQGPTEAELEAMIASRVAAQERRLRAELEAQRLALEEKIASLEAANEAGAAARAAEDSGDVGAGEADDPESEPPAAAQTGADSDAL